MIPAWYATMYIGMTSTARDHGYALAIHGSMQRDLDLIAVPWTANAVDREVLIEALVSRHGLIRITAKEPIKPHGRRAYSLSAGQDFYVDLSVMPRDAAEV